MSLKSLKEQRWALVGGVAIREPDSRRIHRLPNVEGKDQYILHSQTPVTQDVTLDTSTSPSTQPEDDTFANVVYDTPSPTDAETGANTEGSNSEADTEILDFAEEKGEDVSNTVALEERTVKLDEGQAGSNPGNTLESRPPEDEDQAGSNPGKSHWALAGPNPEPMHENFIATVYLKVYKSLKHTIEEHVFLEIPPSSSGTLSSMKNLDDAFTFGDQFIDDKSLENDLGKATVDTKVESMIFVHIHQASSSVPQLSTPIIDLLPPKPVSPPIQALTITALTATTITIPLPPPPP
ncbi:hypothetical protein Tco_0807815 [Tanacetum coccineum]